MLRREARRRPARHDDLHEWRGVEQVAHAPCRVQQLLEVVEHEQDVLSCEVFVNGVLQLPVAGLVQAERLGDGRQQQRGLRDGLQGDEPHAVPEQLDGLRGSVESKSGLARAAGARECYEPHVVVFEQRVERLELGAPPDQRRRLRRKVCGTVLERAQLRELRLEAGCQNLIERLWLRQVLEAVLAEVACVDVDQIARRLREHNLPAVRRGADARSPVDVEADVVVADDRRLAGMQSHPHAERKPSSARCPAAAAATASFARANAWKRASPCVSTSRPSWNARRSLARCSRALFRTLRQFLGSRVDSSTSVKGT